MKKATYEFHRQLSKKVPARRGECFSNARKALKLPELSRATYMEGIVGVPETDDWDAHAWLVLDGTIIDPTLGLDARFNEYEYFGSQM